MAGARTGLVAFFCTVLGLAILAGATYATAPLWLNHVKPYLPAALKDPFEDPRIIAVANRAKDVDRLKQAQSIDAAAIQQLHAERARFSQQLSALMKRLDEQDKSLKSMQKIIRATIPPSGAVDANKSLSRLSDKLSTRRKNQDSFDRMLKRIAKLEKDEKEITRIIKRMNKLETSGPQAVNTVTGASATVLAVNQLRDALRRSAPFAAELGLVKRLAKNNPDMLAAIAVLEPLSPKGAPTITMLRTRFLQTAREVVKAAGMAAEKTWMDRVMNRLKGLVTIRRIGEKGDTSPEALMARAEESLEGGNLMGALKSFQKLTGEASIAAKAWVTAAQTRVAAEQALAKLHVQAVAQLASGEDQKSGKAR